MESYFPYYLQKKIVAMMLFDKKRMFRSAMPDTMVEPEYFSTLDPFLGDMVTLINDFHEKYGEPITESEFLNELNALAERKKLNTKPNCERRQELFKLAYEIIKIGKRAEGHFTYVRMKVIDFNRRQNAYRKAKDILAAVEKARLDDPDYVRKIFEELRTVWANAEEEKANTEFWRIFNCVADERALTPPGRYLFFDGGWRKEGDRAWWLENYKTQKEDKDEQ